MFTYFDFLLEALQPRIEILTKLKRNCGSQLHVIGYIVIVTVY
jgi:hypothetical protein